MSNKNKKTGSDDFIDPPLYLYDQNYIKVLFSEMCEIIDHMAHIVCNHALKDIIVNSITFKICNSCQMHNAYAWIHCESTSSAKSSTERPNINLK